MKRTIQKWFCAALAATCFMNAEGFSGYAYAETQTRWDVNGNGVIDLEDVSLILRHYAMLCTGDTSFDGTYDVDGNGTIDLADASAVLNAYAENASGLCNTSVYNAVYDEYLFVGDSRTVGMSWAVDDMNAIAKVSMGYSWLTKQLDTIRTYENTNLVFWFGVNDLYNAKNYITLYNELQQEIGEKNHIYILAVTPCSGSYAYLNAQIESFNRTMQNGLNEEIVYIDAYSYLQQDGFGSSDGLHYYNSTYKKIYQFACNQIQEGGK